MTDEIKNADEIVTGLKFFADKCDRTNVGCHAPNLLKGAADLIDSLTSQLADQTARANICEHDATAWREDRDRLYEQLAKYKNTGLTPDEVQTGFNDHMDIAVGRAIDAKEENLRLRAELEVSRRGGKAAVEGLEHLMKDQYDNAWICDHCAKRPTIGSTCKECNPKWRGPQEAEKGAADGK